MAENDILGAWFMWPEGGFRRPRDLPEDSTLIVYFHGNSQDRGFGHRVSCSMSSSLVLELVFLELGACSLIVQKNFILLIATITLKTKDLAIGFDFETHW